MPALLLRGGRVVDPADGTDAVLDLLVVAGVVQARGQGLAVPEGVRVVDVSGLLVGPGFVDLHSHVHSIAGQRLQAFDGVTTALDLEAGLFPLERAYREAADQGRPLHYGFSASWAGARALAHLGVDPAADMAASMRVLGDPEWQRSSSSAEQAQWLDLLRGELAAGALGVGALMGYTPRIDPAEFLAVSRLATDAGAPVFTHVRDLVEIDPTTPVDGSAEVLRAAAETGGSQHHCHVNSTSLRHVDRVLAAVERSRADGARVTVEAYPYGAGSTAIGATFLAPERLAARGLTPSSLVLVDTGERIADATRLREVRQSDPGAACLVHFLDEDSAGDVALLDRALAFPDAVVASDAMPVVFDGGGTDSTAWPLPPGRTHPRTAGTFGRSLRRMVRETGSWTWLEAFRRCSYLPARVLDEVAPAAARKGHLGVGADADVVVLDPETFTDRATYRDPVRPSVGVRHLLVTGEPVIRDGVLVEGAFPGRPLRGEPR